MKAITNFDGHQYESSNLTETIFNHLLKLELEGEYAQAV